jgi:hypothetical protein
MYHLWTIQDAKMGDILIHNGCTFIFMGIKNGIVQAIEEIIFEPIPFGKPGEDNDYHPATKEQRDTFEKAMADAGYTFDFDKKELKKIENKPDEWSEEDEKIYQSIMDDTVQENQLNSKQINWLRDIKYRYFPQPKQEWSEEAQQIIKDAACFILSCVNTAETKEEEERLEELADKLQDLRPQNHWKPSDEQMEALNAINVTGCISYSGQGQKLINLYNDLKNLK